MQHKLLRSIALAISVGPLALASTSHGDPFNLCIKAKTAFEKIERCSVVILHSRWPKQLERAYLRRGNAYREINRFDEAVNDFAALIRINPTVAGYYDNRQDALKSLGRLNKALDDANMAIQLAPTQSWAYRSRAGVYGAMGHYDSAIADYTKGISINPGDAGFWLIEAKFLRKPGSTRRQLPVFRMRSP